MSLLLITCPHCSRDVHVPANVETTCPQCRNPVIAEAPLLRAQAKQPGATSSGAWVLFLIIPLGAFMWPFEWLKRPGRGASSMQRVELRVEGSASKVNITYSKPDGGIEQVDERPPWERSFTAQSGDFMTISAQNQTDTGDVRVTILLNGVTAQGAAATAEYGIASTSLAVP